MVQIRSLEAELDERHRAANLAFARKDLLAYQQMFSPALVYQRADGEIVSRDQLMRDVALQFRNLSRSDSSYVRESLVTVGDKATETLAQKSDVQTTAFGILHRRWTVSRRGNYTWHKSSGIWLIELMPIDSETVSRAGWRVGLRGS